MHEDQSQFAAFIGIDWPDRKHDICLQVAGSNDNEFSVLEHRPAAIEAWAQMLAQRFSGKSVAVCIELSQGPMVSALQERDEATDPTDVRLLGAGAVVARAQCHADAVEQPRWSDR